MSYNLVGKRSVPEGPYHYELVCVPMEAIPFVAGALRLKKAKYWWLTDDDTKRANDLLTRFENGLLMPCGQDIVNAIDRVTTRLDAAYFGQYHYVTGNGTDVDPFVYNPAIRQAPDPEGTVYPPLLQLATETKELTHNLVDGTPTALSSETRNIRDMLQEVITTVANGATDDEALLEALEAIALLL